MKQDLDFAMKIAEIPRRAFLGALSCAAMLEAGTMFSGASVIAQERKRTKKAGRIETPPPTHPPLEAADITRLAEGAERLDLFLLLGQSNMKGRGIMPPKPDRQPRLAMMHLRDDQWYLARHPLHLTGDPQTFAGADNAGVGPGLSFAERLLAEQPSLHIGLIPCAVGGSQIALWQKGAKLYDEALRRADLALQQTAAVRGQIRGALWLQGEADATEERLPLYEGKLARLIDDLRSDLEQPDLPFIAATIGEMRDPADSPHLAAINRILLSLPAKKPATGCVDGRDLKTHIGDSVHFDTAAQMEIGRRYATEYLRLVQANRTSLR